MTAQAAVEHANPVAASDPELYKWIAAEAERQEHTIELIASENHVSPAVMAAVGSCLTNKYAEGYPGARYYGGCQYHDEVERLAIDRARKLFNCVGREHGADAFGSLKIFELPCHRGNARIKHCPRKSAGLTQDLRRLLPRSEAPEARGGRGSAPAPGTCPRGTPALAGKYPDLRRSRRRSLRPVDRTSRARARRARNPRGCTSGPRAGTNPRHR